LLYAVYTYIEETVQWRKQLLLINVWSSGFVMPKGPAGNLSTLALVAQTVIVKLAAFVAMF